MGQIREIKKRMVAVKNIERITKTMQMIATAKFTNALARAKATKPYSEKIRELVAAVARAAGDVDHPLITGPSESPGRELLLVIVSDRGLAGAYNTNVLRRAVEEIRAIRGRGRQVTLEVSGKKAVGYFRFAGFPIDARHTEFGDKPPVEAVHRLAERYIEAFEAGRYDAVRVAHMRFVSNARQVPEVVQLLPLTPPTEASEGAAGSGAGSHGLYHFSPSAADLLSELLPATVKTALFQAFNDAVVSEHIMRMVAMKAATDNAKGLGKSLKRDFNRARQAQITTELMEVIGGAAAVG